MQKVCAAIPLMYNQICCCIYVVAGIDYQPLRRNVTLSDLQAVKNLEVTIFNDCITERTETFEARIVIPEETE